MAFFMCSMLTEYVNRICFYLANLGTIFRKHGAHEKRLRQDVTNLGQKITFEKSPRVLKSLYIDNRQKYKFKELMARGPLLGYLV